MSEATGPKQPSALRLWAIVFTGIVAISCASILVRLAHAPALSIATYRVALAALILAPFGYHQGRRSRVELGSATLGMAAVSGVCLAFHFIFWIRSLQKTSIASSTTLVSTTPLFVALTSYCFMGERLPARTWAGIALAFLGSAAVAGQDLNLSREALMGDGLALAGAVAAAGYLLAGKAARRRLHLAVYTALTYGTAALVLLILNVLTEGVLTGFSRQTYLALVLLAVIPQLLGHTSFNWALRFLPSTTVSLLILGEPIGASLLAYFCLGETMSLPKAMSLTTLALGIAMSAPREGQTPRRLELESRRQSIGCTVDTEGETK